MAKLVVQKTSFTAGEISPRLLGRGDLSAYDNGAKRLRNVFIHPTGGVSRRAGLRYIDTARGKGRLIAFEFNTEQVYLLVFTDGWIDVYRDDAKVAEIAAPWSETQIAQINWVQSADVLFVVHPNVQPRRITRTSDSDWTIESFAFDEKDGRVRQPHHKFAADAVTLAASATTGSITLTASADVFVAGHVGTRFRFGGKEVEISGVASQTSATATVKETLAGTAATKDWEEQAFSAVHGWPVSICFHQDRMVLGGGRDLPNRLWLSRSGALFDFDLGEGLDDEAIEFSILSDQVNAIRAVFSGRHLQVFTSGAEWMVTGDPLTPTNVQLGRQTRIGSPVDRTVPPRDVDGATLFVPRAGAELREFLFADVEQAYQATDLATLAQHLIVRPVDQDFDKARRLFHLVMSDGRLATVTIFRSERVTAWSSQETAGKFLSIAVAGEDVDVLVERAGGVFIERFDDTLNVDSGLTGTANPAEETWTELDHLNGETVKVVADGAVVAEATVESGTVTLDEATSAVEIGLGFSHAIEPLPAYVPSLQSSAMSARVRPVTVTLRLQDTGALSLDTGRGPVEIPFRRFGDDMLDAPPGLFSGDKTVRAFGWRSSLAAPLWRIEQNTPLPFTLLSVAAEIGFND